MIPADRIADHVPAALCLLPAASAIATGSSLVVIIATSAALAIYTLAHPHRRARCACAPFVGAFDHRQTLTELLGLVGSRVHVLAAARADGWGVVTLRGTLSRAGGVGPAKDDTLFFAVGNDGGFFLPRRRFHSACHVERTGSTALALHIGEALVYVLDDQSQPA
jgi:hypothetical protein